MVVLQRADENLDGRVNAFASWFKFGNDLGDLSCSLLPAIFDASIDSRGSLSLLGFAMLSADDLRGLRSPLC